MRLTPEERDMIGHPNMEPPNLREITEKEFWHVFLRHAPRDTILVQATRDREGNQYHRLRQFHLFVYRVTPAGPEGIAIEEGHENLIPMPKAFYRWGGCIHEWERSPESRMCLHVHYCKRCGQRVEIDTSD